MMTIFDDALRFGARSLFAYIVLLVLLRLSGKRVVRQASPFDFVFAIVLGDTIDNALWAEVPLAQFVVAAVTLVATKLALMRVTLRAQRAA